MSRGGHGGRRSRRGHGGGHDDEGHPDERWLVTYADMLTLLLVLFIVLYAMSVVDPTKFVQLKTGLAAVFDPGSTAVMSSTGGITSTDEGGSDAAQDVNPQLNPKTSTNPDTSKPTVLDAPTSTEIKAVERAQAQSQATRVQAEVNSLRAVQQNVEASLAAQGLQGNVQFSIDERGLVITVITSNVVFGGNSAVLLSGGMDIINHVAPALTKLPNRIEVDGHTNQQNVSTGPYPSGWELSSARASSVVRYLIENFQISPSRLTAVGYSDQKPLYPPSDPRSITRNRRVDLVVQSTLSAADRALLPTVANPTATTSSSSSTSTDH
jgi:chemotaxis protein MotB